MERTDLIVCYLMCGLRL